MIKLGHTQDSNAIIRLNCAFCIITLQWSGTNPHYLSPCIHPRGICVLITIIASSRARNLTTFGFRATIRLRLCEPPTRDSRLQSHLVVAKQTAGDLHPSAVDVGIRRHFPLLFGRMFGIRSVSRTTEIRGVICLPK